VKVLINLSDAPSVIAESVRSVLAAHNFVVCRGNDTGFPVDDQRYEQLLAEIGNNTAQVLFALDEMPESAATSDAPEWRPQDMWEMGGLQ
jgi:hypothetical protein